MEIDDGLSKSAKSIASSFRESLMTRPQYIKNLIKLTIIWSVSSFSFYCLQVAAKYNEGSVFLNYYLDGIAGMVGTIIAQPIYNRFQAKITFLLSYGDSILFGILVLAFQLNWISPNWIEIFGIPPSGHPVGSKADREYHLGYLIPALIFMIKIGVNTSFLAAYRASFNEDFIFPFFKRATAVGICNFIARSFTILAPLCAEIPTPGPIIIHIFINLIAFITCFTLPSKEEGEEFLVELDLFMKSIEERRQARIALNMEQKPKEE